MSLNADKKGMEENNNVVDLKKYLNKKIEPQNLQVKFDVLKNREKHLYRRCFALAIDIMFVGVLHLGINAGLQKFLDALVVGLSFSQKYQVYKSLQYFNYSILLSIFYGYFLFCFYSLAGKTIGKSLMKLTVINADYIENPNLEDFKMSFGQALSRTTGYLISYISVGILFALPFMRKDFKSLSEILSGTVVLTQQELYEYFLAKNKTEEVIKIDLDKKAA